MKPFNEHMSIMRPAQARNVDRQVRGLAVDYQCNGRACVRKWSPGSRRESIVAVTAAIPDPSTTALSVPSTSAILAASTCHQCRVSINSQNMRTSLLCTFQDRKGAGKCLNTQVICAWNKKLDSLGNATCRPKRGLLASLSAFKSVHSRA